MIAEAVKRRRKSLVPHCLIILFVIQAGVMYRWFVLSDNEAVETAPVSEVSTGYKPMPTGDQLNKVAIASQETMPTAPREPSYNPATSKLDDTTLQLYVAADRVALGGQLQVFLNVEGSLHPAPILEGTLVQVDGGNVQYFSLHYDNGGRYAASVNTHRLEPGLYQVALDVPLRGDLLPLTTPVTIFDAGVVTADAQVN